ncbi:MAG: hypothetical protein ACYC0V_12755 [Armatimonadota bacterium]
MSKAKIIVVLISLIFCSRLAAQDAAPSDTYAPNYKYVKGDSARIKRIMLLETQAHIGKLNLSSEIAFPSQIVDITFQKIINVLENGDAEIYSENESTKYSFNGIAKDKVEKGSRGLIAVLSKTGITKSITRLTEKNNLDRSAGELLFQYDGSDDGNDNSYDKPIKLGESWIEDTMSPFGGKMHCVNKLVQKDVKYDNDRVMVLECINTGIIDKNFLYQSNLSQEEIDRFHLEATGTFKMQGTDKVSMINGNLVSSCGLINIRLEILPRELKGRDVPPLKLVMDGTYETLLLPVPKAPAPKKPMPKKPAPKKK